VVVLPDPVGPGDKHHAVGFFDIAAELGKIVIAEADHIERKLGKLFAHRFFVEHTQHGVFAMNGGHDGDAEIDEAAFIAHAETAVLRNAAFGDIELAHDLDTRNDRRIPFFGDGRHGVLQNTVNAVFDGQLLIARFDVNIAGAPFEGVEDGGIHQLDDGRDVGFRRR
jgi:hypothetical protein